MNAGMKTVAAGCVGAVMALGLSAQGADNLFKPRVDWPTLKAEAWFPANPELDAGKPADYIAVDTAKTYQLGAWLNAKTQDTRLSFGLAMYDAEKRLITPPGGKYVWIVADIPVSPVDWVEYTQKISGEGAHALAFLPGTKFVRVVLWLKTGQLYFGTQFVTFSAVAHEVAPHPLPRPSRKGPNDDSRKTAGGNGPGTETRGRN